MPARWNASMRAAASRIASRKSADIGALGGGEFVRADCEVGSSQRSKRA